MLEGQLSTPQDADTPVSRDPPSAEAVQCVFSSDLLRAPPGLQWKPASLWFPLHSAPPLELFSALPSQLQE